MKKTGLITTLILLAFVCFSQQKRVLSLQDCIDIAVENNLTVQRSELNLQTAEIGLMQAKAQRYPTLNASGNYGFNWGRGIDPTTNQFIDQRINFNGVGANTSLALINGLQIHNSIKQSKLDAEASNYDLQRATNDISLNTALNYVNVIFNKELLENARFQLESSKQQLERTTLLVESGALPLANKLQLESQVATNEVNLITAQNNLDLAVLTLKQGLLLPPGEEIDISIPDITVDQALIEQTSIIELYNEALENQPEIKSAELRVRSASAGLDVSRGGMYPTLSLNGSVNTNYSDAADRERETFIIEEQLIDIGFLESNPTEVVQSVQPVRVVTDTDPDFTLSEQYQENLNTRLSLNLNVPIFNNFRTRSDVQRSKIALQQAEINETEQKNILYQTIESSYRNALAAAKTYDASLKQVASLEETFRAVENQYNNGAVNFTDYQVATNNVFQAKTDLSRAKFDYVFRKKVLEFYQGRPLTF